MTLSASMISFFLYQILNSIYKLSVPNVATFNHMYVYDCMYINSL